MSLWGHTNRGVHLSSWTLLSTNVGVSLPHWPGSTHLLFSTSIIVPDGHSQPSQQSVVHSIVSLKLSQVRGQDDPQVVYIWPSIGQAERNTFIISNRMKYHAAAYKINIWLKSSTFIFKIFLVVMPPHYL